MGENSAIEWCDHTWNPWIGCTRVSPGCDNCYAEQLATTRLGVSWGPHAERRFAAESTLNLPHRWNRRAAREGRRARVFCASLADIFDNKPPAAWLLVVLDTIRQTPHLDWLLLTKRPQQIIPRLCAAIADADAPALFRWDTQPTKAWIEAWLAGEAPPNVWLGTTAENQTEADRRIPHLLRVPAAKRFLSCEPLLGPVDLRKIDIGGHFEIYPLEGTTECEDSDGRAMPDLPGVDWVIAGGESGPRARPSHPDWHRSLRDQCAAAGVPFFFKQWGEWAWTPGAIGEIALHPSGHVAGTKDHARDMPADIRDDGRWRSMTRVGKKRAGALLDGREHRETPDA